jgi:hypothetical protein
MPRNYGKILALGAVAVALVLIVGATTAGAQSDSYAVTYYTNAQKAGAPDAHLRLINDGNTNGNLWADIYVFNNDEQMEECCSCVVTPDGILDLDANVDLLGNQLAPEVATSNGVVKVLSSTTGDTAPTPTAGIRGWFTHIQNGAAASAYTITETDLKDSILSGTEESFGLAETCAFVHSLGSGHGVCTVAGTSSGYCTN